MGWLPDVAREQVVYPLEELATSLRLGPRIASSSTSLLEECEEQAVSIHTSSFVASTSLARCPLRHRPMSLSVDTNNIGIELALMADVRPVTRNDMDWMSPRQLPLRRQTRPLNPRIASSDWRRRRRSHGPAAMIASPHPSGWCNDQNAMCLFCPNPSLPYRKPACVHRLLCTLTLATKENTQGKEALWPEVEVTLLRPSA